MDPRKATDMLIESAGDLRKRATIWNGAAEQIFFLTAEAIMGLSEEEQNALAASVLHKPYIMQIHAKMLDASTCVFDVRSIWEAGTMVIN